MHNTNSLVFLYIKVKGCLLMYVCNRGSYKSLNRFSVLFLSKASHKTKEDRNYSEQGDPGGGGKLVITPPPN